MSILEMTLMGGVMIIVITILRKLLLNKLPKKTFVFLWETAMLRLILPFSVPSYLSFYSLFSLQNGQNEALPAAEISSLLPDSSLNTTENFLNINEASIQNNVQKEFSFPLWTIIWLSGIAITAAFFVVGYIRIYRKYQSAERVKSEFIETWSSNQKLRRKLKICLSPKTRSPLTYGVFRPKIILPEDFENKDPEQLCHILTHEFIHIKRFDAPRKMAAAAVLCLHWFDPLVWLLYFLYNRDIELSCDEAVVLSSQKDCRSAYALALILTGEKQSRLDSLCTHFSKSIIEERIVAIMKTRKKGIISTIAACALALGVVCVFATSAAANEKEPPDKTAYKGYAAADGSCVKTTEMTLLYEDKDFSISTCLGEPQNDSSPELGEPILVERREYTEGDYRYVDEIYYYPNEYPSQRNLAEHSWHGRHEVYYDISSDGGIHLATMRIFGKFYLDPAQNVAYVDPDSVVCSTEDHITGTYPLIIENNFVCQSDISNGSGNPRSARVNYTVRIYKTSSSYDVHPMYMEVNSNNICQVICNHYAGR